MSPSPADRFSALLAASRERGWSNGLPAVPAGETDRQEDVEDATDPTLPGPAGRRLRPSSALVLLLLCAGAAALVVYLFAPQALPGGRQVETVASRDGAERSAEEHDAAPGSEAGESGARDVVVHVVGAVAREGVVELPAGSRVADALAAAGGPADGADPTGLNLARPLTDGEQIRVPTAAEVEAGVVGPAGEGTAESGAGADGDAAPLVDLNTADTATLETLPGVGPVTAQSIIDHREEAGGFGSVEQLLDVPGIGEATLGRLRDLVTV